MPSETKWILFVVAIVALLAGGFSMYRSAFDNGRTAGRAEIQGDWDANKAQIQATTDAAIAQARKERDQALQTNGAIRSDYQIQLDASRSLNTDLSRRLRDYQARAAAGSSGVPKAGSRPSTLSTGSTPSLGQLNDALGGALNECAANRAQLDALIAEIRPQL
jgi:hypothetical protein